MKNQFSWMHQFSMVNGPFRVSSTVQSTLDRVDTPPSCVLLHVYVL